MLTERGRKMICAWEGLVLRVYLDVAGYPTAGYGHKLSREERFAHPIGSPISQEQADAWFKADSAWVDDAINSHVHVTLNENQRAAIECLVFNTGAGVLCGTAPKLMAALNRGDFAAAADEFLDICHTTDANTGKIVRNEGLANRRKAERAVFLAPVAEPIDPDSVLASVGLSLSQIRDYLPSLQVHGSERADSDA